MNKHCHRQKNAFDGLSSRLDLTEERVFELMVISIPSLKTEHQREQRLKTTTQNIQGL